MLMVMCVILISMSKCWIFEGSSVGSPGFSSVLDNGRVINEIEYYMFEAWAKTLDASSSKSRVLLITKFSDENKRKFGKINWKHAVSIYKLKVSQRNIVNRCLFRTAAKRLYISQRLYKSKIGQYTYFFQMLCIHKFVERHRLVFFFITYMYFIILFASELICISVLHTIIAHINGKN